MLQAWQASEVALQHDQRIAADIAGELLAGASAPHHTTCTTQAAGHCGVDHLGGHGPRIAVAVILSSQQVADAASHNAGEVCSASGPPPAAGQWVPACEVLLLSVAGAGSIYLAQPGGLHRHRFRCHLAGLDSFLLFAVVVGANA
jgi:hypothetical protein